MLLGMEMPRFQEQKFRQERQLTELQAGGRQGEGRFDQDVFFFF